MRKTVSDAQIAEMLKKVRDQIARGLNRLALSLQKAKGLSSNPASLSDDELEIWDSLASRFARVVDLFTSKYVRLSVLKQEPGFRGSTRDLLDIAEKANVISSAQKWFEIRELRNRQAHEYEDDDLRDLFEAIRKESEFVMALKKEFTPL